MFVIFFFFFFVAYIFPQSGCFNPLFFLHENSLRCVSGIFHSTCMFPPKHLLPHFGVDIHEHIDFVFLLWRYH